MLTLEAIHTVLLAVLSIVFTFSIPWLVTIERRLSRIEQQLLSDLVSLTRCVEGLKDRLYSLEIEHAEYHPRCVTMGERPQIQTKGSLP